MPTHQQISFRRLLSYVWEHSLFYRDYYSSHGLREKDLAEIAVQDLPFLTKKTLMENFDAAVTDLRLRKKELEHWIENIRDPYAFYYDDLIVLHSSGSSGNIAIFAYDREAWQVMNTTVAAYLPPPERGLHGRSRVATYLAAHGHFAGVTANVLLPRSSYEVVILSLLDATERVVERLNEFQPDRLGGYSSSVVMLAELAIQGDLRICPQTVIVSGDLLTQGMERKIREAWNAPIHVVYAASESIYLGIRGPNQSDMTVMDQLNILEVLDPDNRPVMQGEAGRTVLTNLFNRTLPILRYELGDYVARGRGARHSGLDTIGDIRGRVNDALPVVLENGAQDTIHPIILSEFFTAGLEIIQFISRRPDHVEINYVATEDIDSNVRREFQRILDMKGALRTTFESHRVPQIAVDQQTGKLHLVRIENRAVNLTQVAATPVSRRRASGRRCLGPNNPFVEFERTDIEQSLPVRFEQMVLKYPNRVAVKTGTHSLTYRELNVSSNRLAHSILQARGKDSDAVALQLEHGADLVVAILGVLKVGGVYQYVDPSYPVKRIADILADLQPGLVLTNDKSFYRSEELARSSHRYLNIDELDPSISAENPSITMSPDALAWILYTSGSTGRPKGVVHNHRNLLHNIMTYTNSMHIGTQDRLSLLHSCNVITSAKNLFGALLNGAAVYPFNVREEGLQRLIAWMIQEGITVYHSVPSLFRHLTDALTGEEKFPRLRLIALGGEPLTKRDVERYKKYFSSDCILVNMLGNTEMGTYRQYFIDKTTPITRSILPAGYAVGDKEIQLLNEEAREEGPGDIGEIVVKSRYLAVGYWRDPAASKAVFIADPNGGDERTYLTGDLGRMATDGCLTYLGRKDFQVKIRGHRVDVAEVEAALLDHAAVKEAVVVAQDDPRNEKRLVAYLAQNPTEGLSGDELRNFMGLRLPDYMIPSAFVWLDRLPLSPDGKVDRQTLPAPNWTESKVGANFVLPRNHLEKIIAGIWQDVLQLEKVGVHDNFFDLGGHSLLLFAVHEKLRGHSDQDLSVIDMLKHPTISSLAQFLNSVEIVQSSEQAVERATNRRASLGRQKQFRQVYRAKTRPAESKDE